MEKLKQANLGSSKKAYQLHKKNHGTVQSIETAPHGTKGDAMITWYQIQLDTRMASKAPKVKRQDENQPAATKLFREAYMAGQDAIINHANFIKSKRNNPRVIKQMDSKIGLAMNRKQEAAEMFENLSQRRITFYTNQGKFTTPSLMEEWFTADQKEKLSPFTMTLSKAAGLAFRDAIVNPHVSRYHGNIGNAFQTTHIAKRYFETTKTWVTLTVNYVFREAEDGTIIQYAPTGEEQFLPANFKAFKIAMHDGKLKRSVGDGRKATSAATHYIGIPIPQNIQNGAGHDDGAGKHRSGSFRGNQQTRNTIADVYQSMATNARGMTIVNPGRQGVQDGSRNNKPTAAQMVRKFRRITN